MLVDDHKRPHWYSSKPVKIEAMRLCRGYDEDSFKKFCPIAELSPAGECIMIPTLEGEMEAKPGDWIIKGLEGEFYLCKNSVFEKKYEPHHE